MPIKNINKIVSMIIQNLRMNKHVHVIDLIKKSDYALEWRHHDNWDGGVDYHDLVFYLRFDHYYEIYEDIASYKEIVEAALNSFYSDESEVIIQVLFVSKLEQFVDWEALAASESKESIIKKLEVEKDILIKVGTGELRIQDVNGKYIADHDYLDATLKKICLFHPNKYSDLWDWYHDYNARQLETYQSRRAYIREMYSEIIETIANSKVQDTSWLSYTPIGWEKVDNAIGKMKEILVTASLTEDYQSVGMYGRELLTTLAQLVFDKEKHVSVDGTDIGKADSKRMLEAYISFCLKDRSKPREFRFAKTAIDFSNELTHNRTASSLDAELCFCAVTNTVNIIRIIRQSK